jgi:hypothetical protein
MLAVKAVFHLDSTHHLLESSKEHNNVKQNDLFATDIQKAAKYHIHYMMFVFAREYCENYQFKDTRIRPILNLLLATFALNQVQEDFQALYETGFFQPGTGRLFDDTYKHVLNSLRPHLLHLVETNKQENYISSTIGNEFGDIYEGLHDHITTSSPLSKSRPRYYEKYMKPLI